ncbi:MAG: tRNA (guanosine(37)-N1)-methyltransferase TrmD [Bdellovibrionota bacterium]
MKFSILTLFPEYFQSVLTCSLLGRASKAGLLHVDLVDLRQFGEGRYRAVDDKPYGGGVGMVMMPEVIEKAFLHLLKEPSAVSLLEQEVQHYRTNPSRELSRSAELKSLPHVVYLSPQGQKLTASHAKMISTLEHVVLVCGHYEGLDERILESFVHEEISIGDYVLTGGEPAAAVVLDAVSRFIPGVVGEQASVEGDTFGASAEMVTGGLKSPMYTRPAEWRGKKVPDVLLSGNHREIALWRLAQSQSRTQLRRPDLKKD